MFSLNKHLKLHALQTHTSPLPAALNPWRLKVWQWEQTFSQTISYSSFFHLNFNFLNNALQKFPFSMSSSSPRRNVEIWEEEINSMRRDFQFLWVPKMVQSEVRRKMCNHFSFVMNCHISAYEPFLFSRCPFDMEIYPLSILRGRLWKNYWFYFQFVHLFAQ